MVNREVDITIKGTDILESEDEDEETEGKTPTKDTPHLLVMLASFDVTGSTIQVLVKRYPTCSTEGIKSNCLTRDVGNNS